MRTTREQLEKKFNIKIDYEDPLFFDKGFYDFVNNNRPSLLGFASNIYASKREKLQALYDRKPFAFETEYIKYYALRFDIKNIFLILDDIESLPSDVEYYLIKRFKNFLNAFQIIFEQQTRMTKFLTIKNIKIIIAMIIFLRTITMSNAF